MFTKYASEEKLDRPNLMYDWQIQVLSVSAIGDYYFPLDMKFREILLLFCSINTMYT